MSTVHEGRPSRGWSAWVLAAALLLGNVLLVVSLLPNSDLLADLAQVAELIAYPVMLAGAGLIYVHLRLTPDGRTAWLTTAAVFGSVQGVGYAAIRVALDHQVVHHVIGLGVIDVVVALVLVLMLATGPGARGPVAPLLLGMSMALLVTTVRVAVMSRPPGAGPDIESQSFLSLITLALYGVLAVLLLRRVPLPAWATRGLAGALAAMAVANVLSYPVAPTDWRSLVSATLNIAGALLLGVTALRLVRDSLTRLDDANRQVDELEAHVRADEVLLHEVASTVAGIVAASHLVASTPLLGATDRQRLESLVDIERTRLDRLLSRSGDEPITEVDLDAVLSPVVLSHRIRGREVEWNPAGTRVLGRAGALTEVVDILLDNSAVHSGSRSVLVDAVAHGDQVRLQVSDDGCGIPAELSASLLDWGTRGANSNGRGIGLNVAGRLVTDMGGRLHVHSDGQTGTTVAVTLPLVETAPRADTILDRRVG